MNIIFLQETRLPAGTCCAQDYVEVRSPCQKGNLGCAVWVSRDSALGRLRKEHLKPLHADERLLIIRLEAPHLSCYLISGHAPHTGHSAQQCDAWWSHLRKQYDLCCLESLPVYVGIDSNGQVGSCSDQYIGPHAADEETDNGARLHAFCEHARLCAPSTFAAADATVCDHDPKAYTWVSPKQTRHRIDYVLVPVVQRPHVQRCHVHHDIDTAGPEDHYPACVRIKAIFHETASEVPTFPRLPVRTVQDMLPHGPRVEAALQQAASIPWDCNVHAHVKALDQSLWAACRPVAAAAKPNRPYVNDDAWALIQARKLCTREMRHAAAGAKRAAVLRACRQWAFAVGVRAHPPDTARFLDQHARAEERLRAARDRKRSLLSDLRKALWAGKTAYIEQQAQKYEDSVQSGDARALFAALRFFRPPGKKVFKSYEPLTLLKDADGATVQTYSAQQEVHRKHFADQEAGHIIAREDYIALCLGPDNQGEYVPAELPSLLDVERVIREAKDGRAPGPSGVPVCLWKAFPKASASALLQVYMKAHLRLTEPVQYRCTKLAALLKKAGLAARADSFRSIALLDPSAKFLHRLQRPGLLQALADKAQPLQQGCLPGSVATGLTHFLLTKMRTALAAKQSFGIIFLDLTAAYYRLLRQAITGETLDDDTLCKLLSRMQVPARYVQDVVDFANGGSLLESSSPHLRRVLASTYRHTFFVLDGLDSLTYTQVGSRPGDSVSDVLFSLALVCVVDDVRACLQSQGVSEAALPIWADDLSLPLVGSAKQVPSTVTAAATALHQACHKRAMCPNYGPGKTEALISFAGPGSKQAARSLFGTGCGEIWIPAEQPVRLRCVSQYCHLGTLLSAKCRPGRDLRRKFGSAQSVAAPLAKKVLRRGSVQLASRAVILDTLATSRAHYGAAVWGQLTTQEAAIWKAGHGSLYRCLVHPRRGEDGPCFPALPQLCDQVGRPSPELSLRILRLEHLRLIAAQQQEVLLQALQLEAEASASAWLHVVSQDIEWLNNLWKPSRAAAKAMTFGSVDEFVEAALHFPGKIRGLLRRAKRRAAQTPQVAAEAPSLVHESCTPSEGLLRCADCCREFPDLHTLRAHQWGQHKVSTFLARQVPQSTCPACLTCFWSRTRLLRHVIHDSPHCGHVLLAQLHMRRPAESCAERLRDTLPPADLPAVRLPGPLFQGEGLFSAEHFLHLQSLGLDGRDCSTSEFILLAKSALSDLATASTETLDAVFAQLHSSHAEALTQLMRAASIS